MADIPADLHYVEAHHWVADPYGEGWLIEIDTEPASLPGQLGRLLSAADYARFTGQ